jgi:hypothetical protein
MSASRIVWTDERRAILARDWPAGVAPELILAAVNALPGPTTTLDRLGRTAWEMKLKRPKGYLRQLASAANRQWALQGRTRKPDSESKPQAKKVASHAPFVGAVAAQKAHLPAFQKGFNPNVRVRDPKALSPEAIQAWIAAHGVTRCPPAAVDITSATFSVEDQRAIAEHQARMDAAGDLGTRQRRAAQARASKSIAGRQAASLAMRTRPAV